MERSNHRNVFAELLEPRVHLSVTGYRPIDEIGNNAAHPTWGTADTDLLRLAKAAYADGIDSPSLPGDQSARAISNILNRQADPSDPSQDIQTVDQNNSGDTLAEVIEANTNITNLQSDVFLFQASISGSFSAPAQPPPGAPASGPHAKPAISPAGVTIELEDSSGDVLTTTQTNAQGDYSFDQLSGPAADPTNTPGVSAVGTYVITPAPPVNAQAWQNGSAPSQMVTIGVGATNIAGVDFIAPPPPPVGSPLAG